MPLRCPKRFRFWTGLLCAWLLTTTDGRAQSLLEWRPGAGIEPRPKVTVMQFKGNDLGVESATYGHMTPYSAMLDFFAGPDAELRERFREDFRHHLGWGATHPACPPPDDPNLTLATYLTPYEYDQPRFLDWLARHREDQELFAPTARRDNPWSGPLACPLLPAYAWPPGPQHLRPRFGYAARIDADAIRLHLDNRYNPARWLSPINEIHHHEQPSLCFTIDLTDPARRRSRNLLSPDPPQPGAPRLVLEYDIEIRVDCLAEEMAEQTVFDLYPDGQPEGAPGITAQVHANARRYSRPGAATTNGKSLYPLEQDNIRRALATRLESMNFQAALMLRFHPPYQLAEFMLATSNQQTSILPPPEPGGLGFLATADPDFNRQVADGGNAGSHAWWRVPVSILHEDAMTSAGTQSSPLLAGGNFVDFPRGESLPPTRFTGRIDVTQFYANSLASGTFPGQRGYWVNQWVGFQGDDPEQQDPQRRHELYWAGFLFEAHGPYRVECEIRKFNLTIEDKKP